MRRRLNLKLLLGLLAAAALLGGGVHLVHGFQESRNAGALLRRAEREQKQEHLVEAEKYLSRYLVVRPDDADALARYGLLLDEMDTSGKGRVRTLMVLERALGLASDPTDDLRRTVRRTLIDLEMAPGLGRYTEAIGHLSALLTASPDNGELEALLGRCHELKGQTGKANEAKGEDLLAREWYEKGLARDPNLVEAAVWLAGLLRGRFNDPMGADRVMDQMIAGRPNTPRPAKDQAKAHLERARYRSSHDLAGASDDVDRARELAPDDADVLMAAAESAGSQGDIDAARTLLTRGIETHSNDARMYQGLAVLESRAGRRADAEAALRQGLKALPDHADLLALLADVLIQQEKPADARRVIATLRKQANVFQPAVDLLEARCLLAEGHRSEAVARLEKARALLVAVPALAALTRQADFLLISNYERLGNPEQQRAASRRALVFDPDSVGARLGEANALLALGRLDEALEEYRKLAPRLPAARVTVARLLLARTTRLPETERAWPAVDQALDEASKAVPDSEDVAVLRAEALVARGRLDPARALLQQARDQRPESPTLWIALASLAGLQHGPDAALATLDQADRKLGDRIELRLARVGYWGQRGGADAREHLAELAKNINTLSAEDRIRLAEGLAGAYARLGDDRAAREYLTRVAEGRPDDPRPTFQLLDTVLQTEADQIDEAAVGRLVARLRQIEGEDGALWRFGEAARLNLRGLRGDPKPFDAARLMLAEVARRRPEWSRVPLLEAEIAERQGDPSRAIDAYLKAVELGERRPGVIRRVVGLLNARRRFAEAERLVEKLAEGAPAAGVLGQLTAEMALRRHETRDALEQARRVVAPDSTDYRDHLWLGQIYWGAGRKAEAGESLRHAVALAGNAPEARLALIDYLSRTEPKDRPAALKNVQAEDAVREAQHALPPDRATGVLAFGYAATGHADQAERQYLDALKDNPNDPALLQALAGLYTRTGQASRAEPYLNKILEGRSRASAAQQAAARRQLALIRAAEGGYPKIQEALALVARNLQARSDSLEDQRLQALLLALRPGVRKDAVRAFEDLARRLPPTPDESFLLAQLYTASGDWPRARTLLLNALAGHEDNPLYLLALARGLLTHDQAAEAPPWVARLVKLQPEATATVELQARLLAAQEKGPEAAALVRTYTRDKPALLGPFAGLLEQLDQLDAAEALFRDFAARSERPEAPLLLAAFLARRGRLAEGLDLCDQAWTTGDPEKVGLACVAMLFTARADDAQFRRVIARLEAAIQAHPDAISLQFDLANLDSRLGRYSEAEALYRRLHERDPKNAGPLNNLAWVLAAAGKGPAALTTINQAIALGGPTPDLLDTRAVAHLAMGRSAPAIQDLTDAIAARPTADKYLHLAQARWMAKDVKGADAALQKAKALQLDADALHPLDQKTYRQLLQELAQR